jgi:DNA polymerase III subunit delta'
MRFADIIGQHDAKNRLIKSVAENRISHAIMLLGPEGAGLLPLAIAYAQYVSCENRTDSDSCGTCASCIKYNKLAHPDLHFVFPVVKTDKVDKPISNNFIDDWRTFNQKEQYFTLSQWLNFIDADNKQGIIPVAESSEIIRKLSFKTYESEYKIMIIWLPERMNIEASNRLLKILEEPYEKTLFILVSEDSGQIIQTILSRTQLIKVPKIDDKSLKNALMSKFEISDTKALNIVRLSNGNMAKALEILSENEDLEDSLKNFTQLMRLSYTRDVIAITDWVEEITKQWGRERIKLFFNYASRMVRENFVLNINQSGLALLTEPEEQFSAKFHPFINSANIAVISEELNKAYYHTERNGNVKIIMLDLALKLMYLIRKE